MISAMDYPLRLNQEQVDDLKYEVVPTATKVYITRLLRSGRRSGNNEVIIWQNDIINRARSIKGLPPYVLESDDHGLYQDVEYAWHQGEFEACIRRLDTAEFIELIVELIEDEVLDLSSCNDLLVHAGSSVRLSRAIRGAGGIDIEVLPVSDLDAQVDEVSHPNIRLLIERMDSCLQNDDPTAVLHASASIFETLAKETVGTPGVQNQTLGGFIDRYRQDSLLPESVLDYIHSIYRRRNTEPLAGHGNLSAPDISQAEAIVIAAMTKAFVLAEKKLMTTQLDSIQSRQN